MKNKLRLNSLFHATHNDFISLQTIVVNINRFFYIFGLKIGYNGTKLPFFAGFLF